jgi:hypothetical protein
MIKIYTYKDGTKAFFENDEKIEINDAEIKALLIHEFKNNYTADTTISNYIIRVISPNDNLENILKEYRSGQYTSIVYNLPDGGSIEAVTKNGELVAMDIMDRFGEKFEYTQKGWKHFDEFVKKYENILFPTDKIETISGMKMADILKIANIQDPDNVLRGYCFENYNIEEFKESKINSKGTVKWFTFRFDNKTNHPYARGLFQLRVEKEGDNWEVYDYETISE